MTHVFSEYITVLVMVLSAGAASGGFDLWSKVNQWTAHWSPIAKQLTVATLAFWIFKLAAFFGISLGAFDPTTLPVIEIGPWVSAILPYIFKLGKSTKAISNELTKREHDPGA